MLHRTASQTKPQTSDQHTSLIDEVLCKATSAILQTNNKDFVHTTFGNVKCEVLTCCIAFLSSVSYVRDIWEDEGE